MADSKLGPTRVASHGHRATVPQADFAPMDVLSMCKGMHMHGYLQSCHGEGLALLEWRSPSLVSATAVSSGEGTASKPCPGP